MAWSFLKNIPVVRRTTQIADFVADEIQLRERKKDVQEHWLKCLTDNNGDIEKAKDLFVTIVLGKPAWLALVRLVDPPDKANTLRRRIDYYIKDVPVPPPSYFAVPPSKSSTTANLNIESSVLNADIEIDGAFVGNTPSTVAVPLGSHQIVVRKKGFIDWSRTLIVSGGIVNLRAELEQE